MIHRTSAVDYLSKSKQLIDERFPPGDFAGGWSATVVYRGGSFNDTSRRSAFAADNGCVAAIRGTTLAAASLGWWNGLPRQPRLMIMCNVGDSVGKGLLYADDWLQSS
jgi:hypothetical protein